MRRRGYWSLVCVASLLSCAAAIVPLSIQAQQPAAPVIGLLRSADLAGDEHLLTAFREGLRELGYTEGRNVQIEYAAGEGSADAIRRRALRLVDLQVNLIVAGGSGAAVIAKASTGKIPIVYVGSADPVKLGLVRSLAYPDENVTGITRLGHSLLLKQLEFMRELLGSPATVAVLINLNNPNTRDDIDRLQATAQGLQQPIELLYADSELGIEQAFSKLPQVGAKGLLIANDPIFTNLRHRIVAAASNIRIPAIYPQRESVESGGLMSYGGSIAEMYRQAGRYAGRILRGAKPSELPVVQSATFELVINRKTANVLGFAIPSSILARADEVVE